MSDYENLSLQIAKDTFYVYLGSDFIAFFTFLAVIFGGYTAYSTLKKIELQLESAKWNALLSFEQDMSNRRQRLSDIAELVKSEPEKNRAIFEEAKESYLNAVDRLASSILNGQFPEVEMKADYREFITSVVRKNEDKFKAGTRYPKILKLYEKWRD